LPDGLGAEEPPGVARGTLRAVAGRWLGPVDIEGSLGVTLDRPAGGVRARSFELGLAASLWLWRDGADAPVDSLRLQGEALYRFALGNTQPNEGNLLLGVLGSTATGYGGGVAVGTQLLGTEAGFLAVARLQISWGKNHRNPWAEKK